MQKSKTIIIAALSTRAFVADAVAAGYEVIAIDAFADADTQIIAKQTIKVKQENCNFDTVDFLQKLAEINLSYVAGLFYGSGFEGNITLLTLIASHLPIFGNYPQTVAQINTPKDFFKTLDLLNIKHPEVCFNKPDNASGWLIKRGNSSGGMHIQNAFRNVALIEGEYLQREISATPVSLLFLAYKKSAQVIGFNLQLTDATAIYPYRYAGNVSHFPLNKTVKEQLVNYANKLTKHYSLIGLNSLDVMVLDDQCWVLEINPRLSSSFGLYQFNDLNFFDLHHQACVGVEDFGHLSILLDTAKYPKGQHVFYAPFNIYIDYKVAWPEWVVDIPMPNTMIEKDAPVCTVMANGIDNNEVIEMLEARLQYLRAIFATHVN